VVEKTSRLESESCCPTLLQTNHLICRLYPKMPFIRRILNNFEHNIPADPFDSPLFSECLVVSSQKRFRIYSRNSSEEPCLRSPQLVSLDKSAEVQSKRMWKPWSLIRCLYMKQPLASELKPRRKFLANPEAVLPLLNFYVRFWSCHDPFPFAVSVLDRSSEPFHSRLVAASGESNDTRRV
jgi:hypothetical protein